MRKKRIEKKYKKHQTGTMIDQRDWFKPMKNIGIFKKPKIERNRNTK